MKTPRLITAIALIALSIVPVAAQSFDAATLIKEEQYGKALQQLESLPESSSKQLMLGQAYMGLTQYDKAKDAFTKASADPLNVDAFIGLSAIDLKTGKKDAAILGFDKVLKANKKSLAVRANVVRYCLSTPADTTLALRYLNEGLAINYKFAPFQIMHGDINYIALKVGPAASDYERAIFYDAKNLEAHRKLGVIHTRVKNYSTALEAFNNSIAIDANQILVYKNLGDLYYMFGKYADAETAYKTFLDRSDANINDVERYAFILFFNKKYDEANKLLDQIMGKSKSETVIYRLKGYMACETKDYETSIVYMQKFFATRDVSGQISSDFGFYAKALAQTKNDSLAMINYEKAIALDTANVEYLTDLGKLYTKNKKHEEAISTYNRLIKNGSDRSTMSFNIGKEYYYKGDEIRFTRDEMLKTLVDNKPNATTDSLTVEMGKYFVEARKAFDIVTEMSPDSYISYLWKGRVENILDPESTTTLSKDNYEKAMAILEKGDIQKNKKPLIECYRSLASYYYLNSEKLKGAEATTFKNTSVSYFEKILQLDPADANAIAAIEQIKAKK